MRLTVSFQLIILQISLLILSGCRNDRGAQINQLKQIENECNILVKRIEKNHKYNGRAIISKHNFSITIDKDYPKNSMMILSSFGRATDLSFLLAKSDINKINFSPYNVDTNVNVSGTLVDGDIDCGMDDQFNNVIIVNKNLNQK